MLPVGESPVSFKYQLNHFSWYTVHSLDQNFILLLLLFQICFNICLTDT